MKKCLIGLGILTAWVGVSVMPVLAVDPLPPEIEKASLEKKAAYWQKTSRESGEQRAKVAQQRYDAALVYKRALLSQAEARLQRVEAQLEGPSSGASEAPVSAPESPSVGLYLMLAVALGGGVFVMHRQMKEAEQAA